jgi:hypothetical protein
MYFITTHGVHFTTTNFTFCCQCTCDEQQWFGAHNRVNYVCVFFACVFYFTVNVHQQTSEVKTGNNLFKAFLYKYFLRTLISSSTDLSMEFEHQMPMAGLLQTYQCMQIVHFSFYTAYPKKKVLSKLLEVQTYPA